MNHAFPIVRDCLEAIGASKCEVMSVLDLRDAYHTLPLAEESQKYCGLTPYYGSPTYVYLRFVWTDKHQKAFEDIKQLLVKPPVLRMVSGNGFFRLESDTSRTAAGATLYQWQNNEWVLVGYHSKQLPDAVRNYRVTELELTGLLANIH